MRCFILTTLLLITIQSSTATIDINQLTQKVVTKVDSLTNLAASSLQKLTSGLDLQKLKSFDLLNIIPKAKSVYSLVEAKKQKLPALFAPSQKETLKYYGHRLYGVNVKELASAFESHD